MVIFTHFYFTFLRINFFIDSLIFIIIIIVSINIIETLKFVIIILCIFIILLDVFN